MSTQSDPLRQKIRRAYYWNSVSLVLRQLLSFGVAVLLARLLDPKDFGLLGLAAVFLEILVYLQDLGIGNVVTYYKDNEEEYPFYSAISLAVAAGFTVLVFFSAPWLASFYREARLAPILRVISVSFLLAGLRRVSIGVLNKRMDFRTIALIDTVGSTAGALIAVVMALSGYGVWSLVANNLVPGVIATAVALWLVPVRPSLKKNRQALKRIREYGVPATLSNLAWQLYDKADFLIVGKVLGAEALGAYMLAFRLATLVNEKFGSIVSGVSFPALSAMEHDRPRVIRHWFSLMRHLSLVSFPLLAALAVNAEDAVRVVYGAKWSQAVAPLRFLCIVGCLRTLTPICCALANAQGRVDINLRYTVANCLTLPPFLYLGARFGGLRGASLAWFCVFPPVCLYLFHAVCRQVGVSQREFLANLRLPLLSSAVAAAVMLTLYPWFQPGLVRLVVVGGLGGVIWLAVVLRERDTLEELKRSLFR